MVFTIELRGGLDRTFRLQKDGSWRRMERDYSLQENDFQAHHAREVTDRTPYGTQIVIDGTEYHVTPTEGLDLERKHQDLSGYSMVFRSEFPDVVPLKDQLRSVISIGDDTFHNSLVLNIYARFELRPWQSFDKHYNDPTIVIRHQTFAAGNDYVGIDAANDDELIDRLFVSSLEGWLVHLQTGLTQEHMDDPASKSLEKIYEEIRALRDQWVPFWVM